MKDWTLRIVSLVLAAAVWFVVSAPRRERVREQTFPAVLSVVSLPREYVVTGSLPESVDVRLRGRVSDIRAISSKNLEVSVDLSWLSQPGEVEITLRPAHINVPPEVEVVFIEPNKFRFRVEQLRQRAVTIRPFLVGEVPDGYTAGQPAVDPDRALVSGPASIVLKLTEVATERIIMTGRTETFVQNVAVVSDSPLVRIVSPLTTSVTVPVLPEIGPNPATDTTTTTTTTEQDNP